MTIAAADAITGQTKAGPMYFRSCSTASPDARKRLLPRLPSISESLSLSGVFVIVAGQCVELKKVPGWPLQGVAVEARRQPGGRKLPPGNLPQETVK